MPDGRRDRLIQESAYRMIVDALGTIGWFDAGRNHQPILAQSAPVDEHVEIPVNTLTVVMEDSPSSDLQMGDNAQSFAHSFWVDFYAENDAVGRQLIGDVRYILQGLHSAAGRNFSVLDIYDYDQATPAVLFRCGIQDVVTDRGHDYTQAHRKFWFTCRFDVEDDVTP